jgi:hypothetical protein
MDVKKMKFAHQPLLVNPLIKALRAAVIGDIVENGGYQGVVCFTSGNAGRALATMMPPGIAFLAIGPEDAPLQTKRWWKPHEVRTSWPAFFDATPGHLSFSTMGRIADRIQHETRDGHHLPDNHPLAPLQDISFKDCIFPIPSGSGESAILMTMAFSKCVFAAVYHWDDLGHTDYHPDARLNPFVQQTVLGGIYMHREEFEDAARHRALV